ncbi:MAG: hypothetical protein RSG52_01975 [Terrisporobacter sp.]|uniref:hypothetical protein n=1 Tax=Terrisporobacter sp. TaxID=1965305 RepID=UPI002FCB64B6
MLDRFFGGCGEEGIFGGCGWWIIILFFLFLAFGDCWSELDICAWIPFLILLLIVVSCGEGFGGDDGCGC